MNPNYPVVEGTCRLTKEWQTTLPEPLNRRVEDGDLVLWRPGLTLYFAVWGNDHDESQAERLESIRGDTSSSARDLRTKVEDGLTRFTYRLDEDSDDARKAALYAFVLSDSGHVQIAAYFDDERDLKAAEQIVSATRETE